MSYRSHSHLLGNLVHAEAQSVVSFSSRLSIDQLRTCSASHRWAQKKRHPQTWALATHGLCSCKKMLPWGTQIRLPTRPECRQNLCQVFQNSAGEMANSAEILEHSAGILEILPFGGGEFSQNVWSFSREREIPANLGIVGDFWGCWGIFGLFWLKFGFSR